MEVKTIFLIIERDVTLCASYEIRNFCNKYGELRIRTEKQFSLIPYFYTESNSVNNSYWSITYFWSWCSYQY